MKETVEETVEKMKGSLAEEENSMVGVKMEEATMHQAVESRNNNWHNLSNHLHYLEDPEEGTKLLPLVEIEQQR